MAGRLDRFRDIMARLDATAAPGEAVESGYYVEPGGRSVSDELASRLAIRPASSHFVLGGVGSGKTTQLVRACERLNAIEDTTAVYVDVSQGRAVEHLDSDTVFLAVAQALREATRRVTGKDLAQHILRDVQLSSVPVQFRFRAAAAELATITRHVIIMVDSLDRLASTEALEKIVIALLPAARQPEIGVVLTAPIHAMYGTARSIIDRADSFWPVSTVDTEADGADGLDFLVQVLRARIPAEVCSDVIARRLAVLSGGVLRDLISLAQSAVEEAYIGGADAVSEQHVEMAADRFGRKHLLGLNADELAILERVRKTGQFVPTTDNELALLHTRRVLEYRTGKTRYAVHPTIAPLLEQLEAA